jgi:hypothetical protein
MKIQHLGKTIECKKLDIINRGIRVCIDLEFEKDRKRYHIIEREIDRYDYNEEADCVCSYGFVSFYMNEHDDLTDAIVGFLANYRLYLNNYTVLSEKTYVSYSSNDEHYSENLQYSPYDTTKFILVRALVQMEDNVDYKKVLDLRIDGMPDTLTKQQVLDYGYDIDDISIYAFAIVSDKEMPKDLILSNNPSLLYAFC